MSLSPLSFDSTENFRKKLLVKNSINLIASGGVSSIQDLINLKEIGCEGAIVGKAIYEGNVTLKELSELC